MFSRIGCYWWKLTSSRMLLVEAHHQQLFRSVRGRPCSGQYGYVIDAMCFQLGLQGKCVYVESGRSITETRLPVCL